MKRLMHSNETDIREEWGGYLTLDSGGTAYYNCDEYNSLVRLNAARYAISFVVLKKRYNKIWIPYYLCKSVYDVIKRFNIDVGFYSLDENLEPILEKCKEQEIILVVNYFGIKGTDFYSRICKRFTHVIFDNTQAFFAKPILRDGVYNVYSPRKFVGVSDGAYIISCDSELMKISNTLKRDKSFHRAGFLLEAIERGTNACYKDVLNAENEISVSSILQMSTLTETLLKCFDYELIKKKRLENYLLVSELLNPINEIKVGELNNQVVPMIYPFLIQNGKEVRNDLVKDKIYCSQWWKWVLEEKAEEINDVERRYSNDLIPIPIDQRYSNTDIKRMIEHIVSFIKQ